MDAQLRPLPFVEAVPERGAVEGDAVGGERVVVGVDGGGPVDLGERVVGVLGGGAQQAGGVEFAVGVALLGERPGGGRGGGHRRTPEGWRRQGLQEE